MSLQEQISKQGKVKFAGEVLTEIVIITSSDKKLAIINKHLISYELSFSLH